MAKRPSDRGNRLRHRAVPRVVALRDRLIRVVNIDLGVDRSHLLAVSPHVPFKGTVDDVRRRLEAVPGVSGVAVAGPGGSSLPLVGSAFGGAWSTTSIHRVDAAADVPMLKVLQYRVTPNYSTWRGSVSSRRRIVGGNGVGVAAGRPRRARGGGAVWPRGSAGRQIRTSKPAGVFTVVGIVPRVYSRGPEFADEPAVYFALGPDATRPFALLFVRTSAPPETMLATVTDALAPVAPLGSARTSIWRTRRCEG